MFQNDFDYRREYFKKHKGLFGTGLYFCSYCGRPITKKNSHVDHIMPKSKNQYLLNRSFNTTISCAKCNLKKSDKVDYRVVQGYASKIGGGVFGGITGLTGNIISKTVQLCFRIISLTFKTLLGTLTWGISVAFRLFSSIIKSIFGMLMGNMVVACVVVAVILLLLNKG